MIPPNLSEMTTRQSRQSRRVLDAYDRTTAPDNWPKASLYLELMIGDVSNPETQAAQETWQQINQLVDEIASLSRSGCPDQEFYTQTLNRLLHAVAAVGGAIWKYNASREVKLRCQVNLAATKLADDPIAQRQHGQLLNKVLVLIQLFKITLFKSFPFLWLMIKPLPQGI